MDTDRITAEDEDFFVQFDPFNSTSRTDADHERYVSICDRVVALVARLSADLPRAIYGVRGMPPISGMLPTPTQAEQMRVSEMRLRKALEEAGLLLRIGVGDSIEEWIDNGWTTLAKLILEQRQAHRQAAAQRIYLAMLSKSLAINGPFSLHSIKLLQDICSSIFCAQGQSLEHKVVKARICSAVYILLKHGVDKGPEQSHYLATMRLILMNIYQQEIPGAQGCAEPLLREKLAECEAAVQQQGQAASKEAKEELSVYLLRLGRCLNSVSKFLEAEEVLERAVQISAELEGIKPVDQRLAELQGVSARCLKDKMKQAGFQIPAGLELSELKQLAAEEANIKALVAAENTFTIMSDLGMALNGQKDIFPEKLPRAEALHRQVLEAKLRHPQYGPENGGTLYTMNDLQIALSGQFKFEEALSIGEKALSIRKRLYKDVNHPRFLSNVARQRVGGEDGRPAAAVFEKAIEDASRRRATQSSDDTNSSHHPGSALGLNLVDYDPNDLASVSYAALMAGLGVKGAYLKEERTRTKDSMFRFCFVGPNDFGEKNTSECVKTWSETMILLKDSLPLPSGHSLCIPGLKMKALRSAMSFNKKLFEEAQDAMQQLAAGSRELQRQRDEEEKKEKKVEEGSTAGSKQQQRPLSLRSRAPKRTCIACGAFGARKKCSRCNQAYACSNECFVSAWQSFHKHSCVKQEE